jgi:hypothetical protein
MSRVAKRPIKAGPKRGKRARVGAEEPGPVAALKVILEQIEGQMTAVIEAVTMTRDAICREIAELRHELSSRMDVLEVALRRNSADIQKNSAGIQSLAAKLDSRADANQVLALEQRVDALESSAG